MSAEFFRSFLPLGFPVRAPVGSSQADPISYSIVRLVE
jgi:hypothetical protein